MTLFDRNGSSGSNTASLFGSEPQPKAEVKVFCFDDVSEGIQEAVVEAEAPEGESHIVPPEEAEAEKQREETERRLADVEREAYRRGMEDARRETYEELEKLSQRMTGAIAYLHNALSKAEKSMTHEALALALMVAEKIVSRKIAEDTEALISTVVSTSEVLEGNAPLRIVCNTHNAERLRSIFDDLSVNIGVEGVAVEEDSRMGNGDFMLYQGVTNLDARMKTRLGRIEKALFRELGLEVNR